MLTNKVRETRYYSTYTAMFSQAFMYELRWYVAIKYIWPNWPTHSECLRIFSRYTFDRKPGMWTSVLNVYIIFAWCFYDTIHLVIQADQTFYSMVIAHVHRKKLLSSVTMLTGIAEHNVVSYHLNYTTALLLPHTGNMIQLVLYSSCDAIFTTHA